MEIQNCTNFLMFNGYLFLISNFAFRCSFSQNKKKRNTLRDVTDCEKIITMHILPNISRSKGNQTMKFGQ